MRSSFFPKGNLIHLPYIFPHYIHILLIHCILLSKEIVFISKITLQNEKDASQFLKKTSACGGLKFSLRSAYLLQSEFQKIIYIIQDELNLFT